MIGIDTNVLIRIFINDNQIQSRKAKKIICDYGTVFISNIVLCETIWVLKTRYHFSKAELIDCIKDILKASHFQLEHRDAIWHAFSEFQQGNSGFSDYVIDAVAKLHGCDTVCRHLINIQQNLKTLN